MVPDTCSTHARRDWPLHCSSGKVFVVVVDEDMRTAMTNCTDVISSSFSRGRCSGRVRDAAHAQRQGSAMLQRAYRRNKRIGAAAGYVGSSAAKGAGGGVEGRSSWSSCCCCCCRFDVVAAAAPVGRRRGIGTNRSCRRSGVANR